MMAHLQSFVPIFTSFVLIISCLTLKSDAITCIQSICMYGFCTGESTCSTGVKCITSTSRVLNMTSISRDCSENATQPNGCVTDGFADYSSTDCICDIDLCNKGNIVGSSAPTTSAIRCVSCSNLYGDKCDDETTTCSDGNLCGTTLDKGKFANVAKFCALDIGQQVGCKTTQTKYGYGNTTVCFCKTNLCNAQNFVQPTAQSSSAANTVHEKLLLCILLIFASFSCN